MEQLDKFEKLGFKLNKQALKHYKRLEFNEALNCLNHAMKILDESKFFNNSKLQVLTYTNYAVVLKKQGNLSKSLEFYHILTDLHQNDPVSLAECYLNICSLHSMNFDHSKALENSLKALSLLSDFDCHAKVVAYQNVGAELEYLGKKQKALQIYKNGWSLADKIYGSDHTITQMLLERWEKLNKMIKEKFSTPNIRIKKMINFKNIVKSTDKCLRTRVINDFITSPVTYEGVLKAANNPENWNDRYSQSKTPSPKKVSSFVKPKGLMNTPKQARFKKYSQRSSKFQRNAEYKSGSLFKNIFTTHRV